MILNENLFEAVSDTPKKVRIYYPVLDNSGIAEVWYDYDEFIKNRDSIEKSLTNDKSDLDIQVFDGDGYYLYTMDEDVLEELQYNGKRDEDEAEEEIFDDSYLFDEEEEDEDEEEVEEQLKTETDPEKRREIVSEISDLADEAEKCEDSNNPYGASDAREEIKKLEEDMTLPAVSDEEILKTEESPSELVEDNAYSNSIIDALNDEWATVQKYQDIVNQLTEHEEFKKFIPVIEDIIKDEKNHVGNLQKVLDEINPKTLPDIKDGEQEATEQMDGEDKEENK